MVLTNTGTVTYHALLTAAGTSAGSGAAAMAPAGTALVVTAIPATGGIRAPIVLRLPVTADLAPGRSLEVPVQLPALPGVQPSYLVAVRLVTADPAEQPTSADGLFWMRGGPALPRPIPTVNPIVPDPNATPSPSAQ